MTRFGRKIAKVFTNAQTAICATVIKDKTRLMKKKKEKKVKALLMFALSRIRLLILLDERDSPSRINIKLSQVGPELRCIARDTR